MVKESRHEFHDPLQGYGNSKALEMLPQPCTKLTNSTYVWVTVDHRKYNNISHKLLPYRCSMDSYGYIFFSLVHSCDLITCISHGCFTGTGALLPLLQWAGIAVQEDMGKFVSTEPGQNTKRVNRVHIASQGLNGNGCVCQFENYTTLK